MSKAQQSNKATNAAIRMQARVTAVLVARAAKHAQRIEARAVAAAKAAKEAEFKQRLAELQSEFGIAVKVATVRAASSNTEVKVPKEGTACKRVWDLAVQYAFDRKATLAAAVADGINEATARTQYALAKRHAGV